MSGRAVAHAGRAVVTLAVPAQAADQACEQSEMRNLKSRDPTRWKALSLSLRVPEGQAVRTPAQRQQAKVFVIELIVDCRVSRKERVLLLNERQHACYYQMNEALQPDQCKVLFAQQLATTSIYREKGQDGRIYIAVKMPTNEARRTAASENRKSLMPQLS